MTRINGVNVSSDSNNAMYKTTDTLKCDICGKEHRNVFAIKHINNGSVRFACNSCVFGLIKMMFNENDNEYIEMSEIENTSFIEKVVK